MRGVLLIFSSLLLLPGLWAQSSEDELHWPKEIKHKEYISTLYQPQLESFKENVLEGRMAVSIKPKNDKMIFGAVWFKATLATDYDIRIAIMEKMDITRVYFPDVEDEEKVNRFAELLKTEIESWDVTLSLDRLIAGLNEVDGLESQDKGIKNEAPQIMYREAPALLVTIDGEARFNEDKELSVEYVINTPFLMLRETGKATLFLRGGDAWFKAQNFSSKWESTKEVPKNIASFEKKSKEKNPESDVEASAETEENDAPEIIIVHRPTELIMVDGTPDYASIEGTGLLYVKNTEQDLVMDISSQHHYLLLAGRWYSAPQLADGNWQFVEPDALPADFAKIPEDSDLASLRVSVPGTTEAQDALLEQSVPQTAEVSRKEAKVTVEYDGEPQFQNIEGTEMSYAINTDKSVLKIGAKYYCIDQAIWFESNSPKGPWVVSDKKPEEVDDLPADCPVYNVKYSYIYDSTPDIVYVGYLPGYTYSYVYGGVVVYGRGYYYSPWYGHYYYPRPVTYGYGVHYNPYTGWGFHVGMSYGWVGWSCHPYHHAYWGPRGYYPGYRHGYHQGYHHGYNNGYNNGFKAGYHAANRNQSQNLYRNQTGVNSKPINRTAAEKNINSKARPSSKPNNMYTDASGNVYKRDGENWEKQSNVKDRSSKPATPETSPAQNPSLPNKNMEQKNRVQPSTQPGSQVKAPVQQPASRPATAQPSAPSKNTSPNQQLDRSYQSRQQGAQRQQNYQRQPSRPGTTPAPSRGAIPQGGRR